LKLLHIATFLADVAITPDGTRAYATNLGSSIVTVINTATSTVIDTISVVTPSFLFNIFYG